MQFLLTNSAQVITVGPFISSGDGVTPATALTVTSCHLTLMVDNAGTPTLQLDAAATASGGSNDMVHVTNDNAGYYTLELTAAQTNFLGYAKLAITDAANHLPVFHEFWILPAMIYNFLKTTDRLDVNLTHIADTAQTARDLGASVLLSSGTGTGQLSITSGIAAVNTTQFNGSAVTAASGRPEVNLSHIAGSAVSASSAQLGVNVVQISADAAAADNLEKAFDGTGYGPVMVQTTIATLASQTSFTLTAGSADNSAYLRCFAIVEDATTAAQKCVGVISAYTGSSKTITLAEDPGVFTMAVGDLVTIVANRALTGTVPSRTLDVSSGGEAGVDWANVGSPTTSLNLSGTTVGVVTALASAERNAIADALLDRNMATGADSGTDSTAVRTVRQALRVLRNRVAISAGTLTVYKEDDTNASFTAAVTTTAGDPISQVNPT